MQGDCMLNALKHQMRMCVSLCAYDERVLSCAYLKHQVLKGLPSTSLVITARLSTIPQLQADSVLCLTVASWAYCS